MIWQFFPIGFRFPVADFSDATRRACWKITLAALKNGETQGITLYDAQQTYDPGSGGPVYLCIACFYGIKQARASAKMLYTLDRLTARLCRHQPFLQANALESFGPYPLLGTLGADGTIAVTEAGEPLLKDLEAPPMPRGGGMRLLLISDADANEGSAESCTRTLGTAAAEEDFSVRRLHVADGGYGTVRALVTGRNGRYETVSVNRADGERVSDVIGILPGGVAVIEAAGRDCVTIGALIRKALDLGYRKICLGASGCIDPGNVLEVPAALGMRFLSETDEPVDPQEQNLSQIARIDRTGLDARLSECECTALTDACAEDDAAIAALLDVPAKGHALLCALGAIGFSTAPGAETVSGMIDASGAIRQCDFAVLHTYCKDGGAAQWTLAELNAQKKPACLLGAEPLDAQRLMRENPVLRGVVRFADGSEDAQRAAFFGEVLPMTGKDVAKTERI